MSGNWETIRAINAQMSMDESLRRIYHEVYSQQAAQESLRSCCVIGGEDAQSRYEEAEA